MNKNMLIASGCTLLLSLSPLANAAVGPYVSGSIGAVMANDSDLSSTYYPGDSATVDFDTGFGLGIAVGNDYGGDRLEVEFGYQENDLDTVKGGGKSYALPGDVSGMGLLVNGYHDFKTTSTVTPFIGAGIGFANVELDMPGYNEDDNVFAYQVGAGLSFAVNQEVNLDLKYRYFGTTDPEFDGIEAEYSSHNVYAGIRVAF